MGAKFRLTERLVSQMIALADSLGPVGLSELIVVAWEFLLRVQSECLPIERGTHADATSLPPLRHSGLYVDGRGALVLRLRRRKHRPEGSLLSRTCSCRTTGSNRCPPHRLSGFLARFPVGAKLWSWDSQELTRLLKRLLTLLMVPGADKFTFKAFRAGKATELAKAGATLGSILLAGEWKSSAVTRYIDEDALDAPALIGIVADGSDGE